MRIRSFEIVNFIISTLLILTIDGILFINTDFSSDKDIFVVYIWILSGLFLGAHSFSVYSYLKKQSQISKFLFYLFNSLVVMLSSFIFYNEIIEFWNDTPKYLYSLLILSILNILSFIYCFYKGLIIRAKKNNR